MSNTRLLRSPKNDIRIALRSGHVIIIGEEPREVGEIFWAEAYSKGAISGDMVDTTIAEKVELEKEKARAELKKHKEVLTNILKSLFDNPRGAIDKNGNPLVRKVSAMYGGPIKKPEMLEIWKWLKETEGQ